ncbi:DUF1878 domain-containing protein, partial [Paenibacillus larvae]
EGYEYGSFHFLEPSFLHNYTDSTTPTIDEYESYLQKLSIPIDPKYLLMAINKQKESDDACQYLLQQYK